MTASVPSKLNLILLFRSLCITDYFKKAALLKSLHLVNSELVFTSNSFSRSDLNQKVVVNHLNDNLQKFLFTIFII